VGKAIQLAVDGNPNLTLVFYRDKPLAEELADLLYQAQDVVAETTTEMWPLCPRHNHFLRPEPGGHWVAWKCPETGQAIAQLVSSLPRLGSPGRSLGRRSRRSARRGLGLDLQRFDLAKHWAEEAECDEWLPVARASLTADAKQQDADDLGEHDGGDYEHRGTAQVEEERDRDRGDE
jgi:hypothetical protein